MNKLNWADIARLIIEVGLPAAESIWQKWATGKDPTQEDFDALKVLTSKRSKDEMLAVLKEQGVDPESSQGKAFLALVV